MTKKWSSTASGDGQTKRQASKAARRIEFHVQEVEPYSWFCDPCKVEVYERRCRHCGKLERDLA